VYIDRKISELKETLSLQLTPEQEKILRLEFADYAFSACIDSAIRTEAEIICAEAGAEDIEEIHDNEVGNTFGIKM
jgi:hypothetical protein